jgi:hypothetical protein
MACCNRSTSFAPPGMPSAKDAKSGVCVGPGQMVLTLIPCRAWSRAIVFAKAIMPPLQAE